MNSKLIFIFSVLFAHACATKELSLTFWDESTGNLKVEATLIITKANDQFQGVVSNLKFLEKTKVDPETVFTPFKWTLSEPLEDVTFNFTYSPDGTFNVTSPEEASKYAKNFAYLTVQAMVQGKFIEKFYAKGERPEVQDVYSFFGLCEPKNIKNIKDGTDFILSFDANPNKCSKKNPNAPESNPENSDSRSFVFADGKTLKKISCALKFIEDGVNHKVGVQLMLP